MSRRCGWAYGDAAGTRSWERHEFEPNRSQFHEIQLVDIDNDGELELVAAHAYPPTHPAQWRADLAVVRSAAAGADLVVGDLNATLDHRPLQRILDAGLRDAAELTDAGWQPTWPANGDFRLVGIPLPPLVAIDHVLVGSRLAALATRTVTLDGSDHRALVAEVALR